MPPAAQPAVGSGDQSVFRHFGFLLMAALIGAVLAIPASAQTYSDAALIDGFMKTVFGAEYQTSPLAANRVKKFTQTVLVHIDNRSRIDRRAAADAFVDSLGSAIAGLAIRRVEDPAAANFVVHVVDVAEYDALARSLIGPAYSPGAAGECFVRVVSRFGPIARSDAVIVSDGGETLFRRCLIEEVLQGLGPVNDSNDLPDSVFNDRSQHARFMEFDRMILSMLYDPRITPGMRRKAALNILPAVIADMRKRVR